MGTRNLTMLISDGETKVAQYGQWDGYPGGQGLTALSFLNQCDLSKLKEKVSQLSFYTNEELDNLQKQLDRGDFKDGSFGVIYPEFSRDWGASILEEIYNDRIKSKKLKDEKEFAADSLFCEYCYVIDLDKRTFEVYEGFNKKPLKEGERFSSMPLYKPAHREKVEYYPVKHVKTYSLDSLPNEKDFLDDFSTRNELIRNIHEFLNEYAVKNPNYIDETDNLYTSPDADELLYCAKCLENNIVPERCHSEWGSGGYHPYTSKIGKEEHDNLVEEIRYYIEDNKVTENPEEAKEEK